MLRCCHNRPLQEARGERGGGYDRDVPGGRLRQEDRGRLRDPLGIQRVRRHGVQPERPRLQSRRGAEEQALACAYTYAFIDSICLKRAWGGSFENVAVMAAIGVNDGEYREVIGAAERFTESSEWRRDFHLWLKGRGPPDVRMFAGDKTAAMTVAEVLPDAAYQRCTVHFYRNVLAKVPNRRDTRRRQYSRRRTSRSPSMPAWRRRIRSRPRSRR